MAKPTLEDIQGPSTTKTSSSSKSSPPKVKKTPLDEIMLIRPNDGVRMPPPRRETEVKTYSPKTTVTAPTPSANISTLAQERIAPSKPIATNPPVSAPSANISTPAQERVAPSKPIAWSPTPSANISTLAQERNVVAPPIDRDQTTSAPPISININSLPQENLDNTVKNTILSKASKDVAKAVLPRMGLNVANYVQATDEQQKLADQIQAPATTVTFGGTSPEQTITMRGGRRINLSEKEIFPETKLNLPNNNKVIVKDPVASENYLIENYGNEYVNRDKNKRFQIDDTDNLVMDLIQTNPKTPDGALTTLKAGYDEGRLLFDKGGLADIGNKMATSQKDEWSNPNSQLRKQYDKLSYFMNNNNMESRAYIDSVSNPVGKFVLEGLYGIGEQASMYAGATDEAGFGALAGAIGGPAGAKLGAKAGFTYAMFKVEQGTAYIQYREAGMDHENAVMSSTIAGAVNAGIELSELSLITKGVPMQAYKIASNIYKRIPTSVLRGTLTMAGSTALTAGAEITQEGIQQFVTNLMQNRGFDAMNNAIGYDKYAVMPPKQLAQATWEEMKAVTPTMTVMAFFGLPANFNKYKTNEFNMKVSDQTVKAIEVLQNLQANPDLKNANPEEYTAYMDFLRNYQLSTFEVLKNDQLSDLNKKEIASVMDQVTKVMTVANENPYVDPAQSEEVVKTTTQTKARTREEIKAESYDLIDQRDELVDRLNELYNTPTSLNPFKAKKQDQEIADLEKQIDDLNLRITNNLSEYNEMSNSDATENATTVTMDQTQKRPLDIEAISVGKKQGNTVTLHESYENQLVGTELFDNAKEVIGNVAYDLVKVDPRAGTVTFIGVDDFDGNTEPIVGYEITVKADGTKTQVNPKKKLVVDRSSYVAPDYTGFDVEQAKAREMEWRDATKHGPYNPFDIENDADYFYDRAKRVFGDSEPDNVSWEKRREGIKRADPEPTPESEKTMTTDSLLSEYIVNHENAPKVYRYLRENQNQIEEQKNNMLYQYLKEGYAIYDQKPFRYIVANKDGIMVTIGYVPQESEFYAWDKIRSYIESKIQFEEYLAGAENQNTATDTEQSQKQETQPKDTNGPTTQETTKPTPTDSPRPQEPTPTTETNLDNIADKVEKVVSDINSGKDNSGIHFGDLGKAEYLMISGGRGTGHFGTGTYFVTDPKAVARMLNGDGSSYNERPIYKVSFEGYNLYKPNDSNKGVVLSNFLKQVNKWAFDSQKYRDSITEMYINSSKLFDFAYTSESELEEYLLSLRDYVEENLDKDKRAYFDKTERYDSPATVFMKNLGYEGIDVRGLKGLDDEGTGSVIYDLRKDGITEIFKGVSNTVATTPTEQPRPQEPTQTETSAQTKAPETNEELVGMVFTDGKFNYKVVANPHSNYKYGLEETYVDSGEYLSTSLYNSEEEIRNEMKWAETRLRDNEISAEQERKKKEKENSDKEEYEFVHGFTDGMSPIQKARVLKILNTKETFNGKVRTRKSIIEEYYNNVEMVEFTKNAFGEYTDKRLPKPEYHLYDENYAKTKAYNIITKTEYDYAVYLSDMYSEKKPIEKVPNEGDNVGKKIGSKLSDEDKQNESYKRYREEQDEKARANEKLYPIGSVFKRISTGELWEIVAWDGDSAEMRNQSDGTTDVFFDSALNTIFVKPDNETKVETKATKKVKINSPIPSNELSTEQLVQRIKSRTNDRQGAYGLFVKERNLRPEINAGEFFDIWDRVTPNPYIETKEVDFVPTHTLFGMNVMVTDLGNRIEFVGENGMTGGEPKPLRKEFVPILGKAEDEKDATVQGVDRGVPTGTQPEVLQTTQNDKPTETVSGQNDRMGQPDTQRDDGQGDDQKSRERTPQAGDMGTDAGNGNDNAGGTRVGSSNVGGTSQDFVIPDTNDYDISAKVERFNRNIKAIELLGTLEVEGRSATKEEQEILARYTGWGGLKEAFVDNKDKAWQDRADKLKTLLNKEQYRSAQLSTENAFYTPIETIRSIYDIVKSIGVRDNIRILEPSAGVGYFIGAMPTTMHNKSKITGVEIDYITGKIAQHLYPKSSIKLHGFEDLKVDGTYDLVVGNVPFGNIKAPYDPNFKKYSKFLIHDYFLLKGIDSLKDGGIMAVITTSGTMDKADTEVRDLLKQKAMLVGAVRLPSGTFGNTDVVSDLLIFQKKAESDTRGYNFTNVINYNGFEINEYFAEKPEMVLGDLFKTTNQFGQLVTSVKDTGRKLSEVIDLLPKNIIPDEVQTTTNTIIEEVSSIPISQNISTGMEKFVIDGDRILKRNDITGELEEWTETVASGKNVGQVNSIGPLSTKFKRVKAMLNLYSTLNNVLDIQKRTEDTQELKKAQEKLSEEYDKFVNDFGYINDNTNKNVMDGDQRYWHLCTLEEEKTDKNAPVIKADKNKKKPRESYFVKGPAFTKRVVPVAEPIKSVSNVMDALHVSLNMTGGVNFDYMQKLYGKDKDTIIFELGDNIFEVPDGSGNFVLAEEYLSGNVRKKLVEAKEQAKISKRFDRNVDALEAVQPNWLSADQISVNIGTPWLGVDIMKQFVNQLYGNRANVKVNYDPYNSLWTIEADYTNRDAYVAQADWSTDRMKAIDLVSAIANNKKIEVRDREGKVDYNETMKAKAKAEEIKEFFNDWIYKESERMKTLEKFYNENYNNLVDRKYDGKHLKMFGVNPKIKLRSHQLNVVSRSITGGNVLFAHPVGSGKTFAMIGSVMEMKRLGIAQKPIMVVPNHKIGDFMKDFYEMYPTANILAIKGDDFTPANRKKLLARIQNTNFDCVIMRHSSFDMFDFSPEYKEEYMTKQIDDLEEVIRRNTGIMSKRDLSNLNKKLEALKKKLLELTDIEKEEGINIFLDTCGIDALIVDEAHNFKNLDYPTKISRIAGVQNSGSKRATNMHMATELMNQRGKKVIFATATPVSNSIGELYTMMRYLQPQALRDYGIESFDAWADTFGSIVSSVELNTTGSGLTTKDRFSKFKNVPELIKIFKISADIIDKKDLDLVLPEATFVHEGVESSTLLKSLNKRLEARKKNMTVQEARKGGHLVLMQDARMASLDLRSVFKILQDEGLVDYDTSVSDLDFENSKINKAVENIYKEYKDSTETLGTQFVFLDRGTPMKEMSAKEKEKFNRLRWKPEEDLTDEEIEWLEKKMLEKRYPFDIYEDIRKKLILLGVKPEEIEFIQDTAGSNSDNKKMKLFEKINQGQVRILLGSTPMMGEGMNAQTLAVALHQIDAPMRPSDVEQRNGRIVRQGNTNEKVRVYYYSTKNSYDAPTWQMLDRKQKAIDQIFAGDETIREIEDIGEDPFANMSVEAANNPLMFERKDVSDELTKLEFKKRNFLSQRNNNQLLIDGFEMQKKNRIAYLEKLKSLFGIVEKNKDSFIVNGTKYETMKDASNALAEELKNFKSDQLTKMGSVNGIDFFVDKRSNTLFDIYLHEKASTMEARIFEKEPVRLVNETADQIENETDQDKEATKPSSIFLRMNNRLGTLDNRIKGAELQIENLKTDYDNALKKIEDKFPQSSEDKIIQLRVRLAEIDELLRMADQQDDTLDDGIEVEGYDFKFKEDGGIKSSYDIAGNSGKSGKLKGTFYNPKNAGQQNIPNVKVSTGKVKSIGDIVRKLSKDFQIPITSKRFRRRGKLGVYLPKHRQIEVKYGQTIGVVSHELGHDFDARYEFVKNNKFIFDVMAQRLPQAVKDAYEESELPGEAMADFMRLYMTDPWGAREFGDSRNGNFYDIFEKTISSGDRKILEDARADILNWIGADTIEQTRASIKGYDETDPIEIFDTDVWRRRGTRFYMMFVDKFEPFRLLNEKIKEMTGKEIKAEDNPLLKAYHTLRADVISNTIALRKLITPKGEIVGEGFKHILSQLNKGEFQDFDLYLKLRHSLDWASNGKLVFSVDISMEDVRIAIDLMNQRYPHFERVSDSLYNWWDMFNKTWLVDTGLLDEDLFQYMRETYPHYVPNFRVNKETGSYLTSGIQRAKGGFGNQRNPMRRASQKGSDMDTYSATQSMILQIDKYVKTVLRRDVMLTLHKNYENDDFAQVMGSAMVRMGPEFSRNKYDAIPKKEELIGAIFQEEYDAMSNADQKAFDRLSPMQQLKVIQQLGKADVVNRVIENIIVYYTPKTYSTDQQIVTVVDKGHTYFYEIQDPFLLEAVANIEPHQLGGLMKLLATIKRAMTVVTTGGNPIFGLTSNVWRDMQQVYIMGSYTNPVEFAKNVAQAVRGISQESPLYKKWREVFFGGELKYSKYHEAYMQYKAFGGGYESPLGTDVNYLKKTLRQLDPAHRKGVINKGGMLIDAIEWFNNIIETVPRLIEFEKVYKEGGESYESLIKAGYRASNVTLDFSRHGYFLDLNAIIPFWNAGIQGLDQIYRGVRDKDERASRLAKSLMLISLPSIAMALLYRDDEDYDDIIDFYRNNYWLFPKYGFDKDGNWVRLKGEWHRIPKPRELGVLFGATFDRAIREIFYPEEDNGKGLAMAFMQNFTMPTRFVFAPIYDVLANKSWSGAPIVSMKYDKLAKNGYYEEQYDDSTSALAIFIAQHIMPDWFGPFDSPMMIEYLIQQYSGGIGQIILPATSEYRDSGVLEGIARKMSVDTAFTNRYVNDFYDIYGKLQAAQMAYKLNGVKKADFNDEQRLKFQRFADGRKGKNGVGAIKGMSDYWKEIREIQNDHNLSNDEKKIRIKAIRNQINDLAERIVKEYREDTKK